MRKLSRRTCKFEELEDRRLLTTFNVTTTADLVSPSVGKLSLRQAIDLANAHPGADVVVLKATSSAYKITIAGGGEDNNATGDFDITDDLTIKSAGSGFPTISGNGLDRVFHVTELNVSLTLNHVIVTGGIAHGLGGGVACEESDTLTLINTTIKNNISTSPGGGLGGGISMGSGDIMLINSHVDNNSAAAGVTGQGGGIYLGGPDGTITIRNSTVNSNSAYEFGGGIADLSTGGLTITGSQINNNHSGDGGGGGVLVDAELGTPLSITSSTVNGNTTSGVGGGILVSPNTLSTINIAKSTLNNNSAASDGGALYGALVTIVNISGSTVANNIAGGDGGAVDRFAGGTFTDCTFNHNVAQGNGGAIDQKDSAGDIAVLRCTFTQNAALTGSGGAINGTELNGTTRSYTFTDSKFTFNSSAEGGGAVQSHGETFDILRCTFDHNSVRDGDGGAIDCDPSNPTSIRATDSKFTYNTSKADGGGFNSEGGDVTLLRCVFSCNTATNGEGGGFADLVIHADHNVTITECTFDGNTAGGNGGGFSINTDSFSMVRSTVSNNRSGSDGGGASIINNNTSAEIINCTFSGNGAAADGGGIAFVGNNGITITNCTIAFNASLTGGGISFDGGLGMIFMGNTIVAKNIATNAPDFNAPAASFNNRGHNLFFSILGIVDGVDASDIVGLDPKLGPLANNGGPTKTHALLAHSPAINAGDDSIAPPTDQRGVKRPQGPHVDIGAYEKKS